ncbi:uncharacterized protein LOC116770623 isoform X1 [Danaus plexippus]|nr:uncharacterized protein LOC116770623 isoform X1 [Danaus plexippus]
MDVKMAATMGKTIKDKISSYIDVPILTRCCFCFPLRKGLITFAYGYLILSLVVTSVLSIYISYIRNSQKDIEDISELPNLIVDITELVLEFVLTIVLIVALHMKHLMLMKLYLYFQIALSIIGFIYSLAVLIKETGDELFLILFELMINVYVILLIWSMIVKTQRDDTVTYTREA